MDIRVNGRVTDRGTFRFIVLDFGYEGGEQSLSRPIGRVGTAAIQSF